MAISLGRLTQHFQTHPDAQTRHFQPFNSHLIGIMTISGMLISGSTLVAFLQKTLRLMVDSMDVAARRVCAVCVDENLHPGVTGEPAVVNRVSEKVVYHDGIPQNYVMFVHMIHM